MQAYPSQPAGWQDLTIFRIRHRLFLFANYSRLAALKLIMRSISRNAMHTYSCFEYVCIALREVLLMISFQCC
jgi:hypothetical protein